MVDYDQIEQDEEIERSHEKDKNVVLISKNCQDGENIGSKTVKTELQFRSDEFKYEVIKKGQIKDSDSD